MKGKQGEAVERKRVMVIYPYQQLYLPEFAAYSLFPGSVTTAVAGSEDMIEKGGAGVRTITPEYRVVPLGRLLTYRFSFIRDIGRLLSEVEPSVVVTYELYSTFSYQVSGIADRRFTHAVICYETIPPNSALWGLFPPTRIMAMRVRRRADIFIALSKRVRDSLLAAGVDSGRIRVIYPGVPVPSSPPPSRAGGVGRKVRILFMGRLRPNKGIATLITAFRRIVSEGGTGVELVIAGDGPLEGLVREASTATPSIRFAGFVYGREKEELVASSDIFVYPSEDTVYLSRIKRWEEQTAAAVREAMAAGLPVIVSDSGSMPEIAGREDVVFPQGDAGKLHDALLRLINSPELREEISLYNIGRSRELFEMNAFASKLEKMLLDAGRRRGL